MAFKRSIVVGAGGAIGSSLATLLAQTGECATVSRAEWASHVTDYSEASLQTLAGQIDPGVDLIVICNGFLHDKGVAPEKRLSQLSREGMLESYSRNVVVPALALKAFTPLMHRSSRTVAAVLTARVGSINENTMGGWYSYRASKAAMNMIVRTASIEVARFNRNASVVAVHPGTTRSELSAPFMPTGRKLEKSRLPWLEPADTARHLLHVLDELGTDANGTFIDWRGETLPW